MNIPQIVKMFQKQSNMARDNEVALFRNFANAMKKHSNTHFIDETHGKVAQVEFTSPINGPDQCEISDLFIVIKNALTNEYRATFWQAKKEPKPSWRSPRGDQSFDFKGQFNQWELLSHRPSINGVGRFQPDPNILRDASSPSIGSFGVFYDEAGDVEVNYSVAEIVLVSSPRSAQPRMVINEKLSRYTAWQNEVLVRFDTASFLSAMDKFSVGAILDPSKPSDQWLFQFIRGKCRNYGKPDFIDIDGQALIEDSEGDGISVLLVTVESNPEDHQHVTF